VANVYDFHAPQSDSIKDAEHLDRGGSQTFKLAADAHAAFRKLPQQAKPPNDGRTKWLGD
jgi:hypothetical protein